MGSRLNPATSRQSAGAPLTPARNGAGETQVQSPRPAQWTDVNSPKSGVNWVARAFEVLALVFFVVLFFLIPDGVTTWVLVANLAAYYLLLLRAVTAKDRIVAWLPNLVSGEVLFFLFSYLIFYYQYQLFLLGMADLSETSFALEPFVDGTNKAITLSTVSMLAFTLGYRAVTTVTQEVGPITSSSGNAGQFKGGNNERYFYAMTSASTSLLVVIAGFYSLAGLRSAEEGRYSQTTTEAFAQDGVYMLATMFSMIVGALWVYAKATKLRMPPMLIVGIFVAIAWNLRLIVAGDRSSVLFFVLALAGGYYTFVRRATLPMLFAAFGTSLVLYKLVEVVRVTPDWYRSGSIWDLLDDGGRDSSFNITTITLRATVETVPNLYDFAYGYFKLVSFSALIPFSGTFFVQRDGAAWVSSSEMLTGIMIGSHANWNTGTNLISDVYMDFGVPGVVAILFCIGLLAKWVRNYVAYDPRDAHRVIMYLLSLALLAESPILEIGVAVRFLGWAFALSLIVMLFTRRPPQNTARSSFIGESRDRPNQAGRLLPKQGARR